MKTLSYCVKCKAKTGNKNEKGELKNGKKMVKSNCTECDCKKSRFVPKDYNGDGIFDFLKGALGIIKPFQSFADSLIDPEFKARMARRGGSLNGKGVEAQSEAFQKGVQLAKEHPELIKLVQMQGNGLNNKLDALKIGLQLAKSNPELIDMQGNGPFFKDMWQGILYGFSNPIGALTSLFKGKGKGKRVTKRKALTYV